jgi:TolB-like protein/class 3 adenylate cyclase
VATETDLQIAHVLFMDVVGYSKLRTDQQRELSKRLNQIVRETEQFRRADEAGKLVRLPTGDGMALAFLTSPDAPVRCAIEVSKAVGQALPPAKNRGDQQAGMLALQLRMGIHSGPVDLIEDVNQRTNVAGAGINIAQRVMDCGDAGHILLSQRVAEDLGQYAEWEPYLHQLGEFEVKHGVRINITNFYSGDVGNAAAPEKLRRLKALRASAFRKRVIIALVALALAALVATVVLQRTHYFRPVATAVEKSIAVLPLENLTEEKENAYFADGIQEELLSNLAKIKDLKVISRTSVRQYKAGMTRNLREIAQQLGVSNVVEGSVRRSGNHVRVSVQLIDAVSDRDIWARKYDRTLADSLALQGELAAEIAAGVGATLSPQEKARVEATPTKNTAAYDAYLRGRALAAGLTPDSNLEAAVQSFKEAVTLDPEFALAWAYLSCANSWIYWRGIDITPARLAAAKDAYDHAIVIKPHLAETHLALGYYRYYGVLDFIGALEEFQLAEQSLPNDVEVLKAIGLIQRRLGHLDEALAMFRRVFELDPRNIDSARNLAVIYMGTRRYPDAVAMAEHILAIEPSTAIAIQIKTFSLWAMGKTEAAGAFLISSSAAPLRLRAKQALIEHRYSDALDLFTKDLREAEDAEDKGYTLLDLGMAQRLAGNVAESKAAYQQAVQEITQALNNVDKVAAGDTAYLSLLHSSLGVGYAGLGDAARAVSEGQKGMAMHPTSEDRWEGPRREELMAHIYALLGDADDAIPILKKSIQDRSIILITPGLLRIDPIWEPIRHDPRFQELLAEKKP